jgi:hypothetical protein
MKIKSSRRVPGPGRDELSGEFRISHDKELHTLSSQTDQMNNERLSKGGDSGHLHKFKII